MQIESANIQVIDRLEKLGFKAASAAIKQKAELHKKLAIAHEFYRFVRPEKIQAFKDKLHKETRQRDGSYKSLEFLSLESYAEVPPPNVLDSLEAAMGHKCFDSYEIASIRDVKDPILFGRINGSGKRFFIDQWADDVKIEDILKPNEG